LTKVLFVCLGNICRSPTAHGVLRDLVRERGLGGAIEVDSCGTSSYHNGEPPDANMSRTAAEQGIDLSTLRSRLLVVSDFAEFDLLVAMDGSNERDMERLRPRGNAVPVVRFMDFVPDAPGRDVPDPYYGGLDGFREVVDLIRAGCGPLLEHALAL